HVVHLSSKGSGVALATFSVGNSAGVARVRIKATMGDESAEENVELPVRPASPTITVGGYAIVTPAEPLKLPLDTHMLPGTVSLSVGVTPWPSLQLPRGLDYLERYPYGCAEQTISTSFPLLALREIGPKIAPGGEFDGPRVREKI